VTRVWNRSQFGSCSFSSISLQIRRARCCPIFVSRIADGTYEVKNKLTTAAKSTGALCQRPCLSVMGKPQRDVSRPSTF